MKADEGKEAEQASDGSAQAEDVPSLLLKFSTVGGIGEHLDNSLEKFDRATKDLHEHLGNIRYEMLNPDPHAFEKATKQVSIRIKISAAISDNHKFLLQYLAHFQNHKSSAYDQHCSRSGKPQCQYGQVFSRNDILLAWEAPALLSLPNVNGKQLIDTNPPYEHPIQGILSIPRCLSFSYVNEM